MKKLFPLIVCFSFAQDTYEGTITFDYTGTVDGTFTSIVQDTISTGFAYNQMGLDTSYFVMGSFTEQENDTYDLFFVILQDTTFPVQPRTWEIPGQGDEDNPLSLETIVVLMPGMDSSFVMELAEYFTDSSSFGDSLDFDSLLTSIFLEFADDLYIGLAGELEISDVTDSSITGSFYTTLIKPEFHIPPHMIMITNGEFDLNRTTLPELSTSDHEIIPRTIELLPAYPNPFNPTTTLRIQLLESPVSSTSLEIFDMKGKMVKTLINGSINAGIQEIRWDARNQPSGVYIAKLQSGSIVQTTKLLLIK